MRRTLLCLVLLGASAAVPVLAQTAPPQSSAQQIIEGLRGVRVPPPEGPAPQTDTTLQQGTVPQQQPPMAAPSVNLIVLFATGSATITPEGEAQLAQLGMALNAPELAQYRFLIEGHTDTVGDAQANQALSERRAAAVAAWLARRQGVAPQRLQAAGRGETDLAVPTPDNTPEVRNRRVRIVNLGG